MTKEVNGRKEAIQKGLKRYFTGKPCKHGHIAERLVTSGCVDCEEARAGKWYASNRERAADKRREWRAKNPGYMAEWARNDHINNPERQKERDLKYRIRHPDRVKAKDAKQTAFKKCKPLIAALDGQAQENERIMDLAEALDIFKAQDNAFDYDAALLTNAVKDRA